MGSNAVQVYRLPDPRTAQRGQQREGATWAQGLSRCTVPAAESRAHRRGAPGRGNSDLTRILEHDQHQADGRGHQQNPNRSSRARLPVASFQRAKPSREGAWPFTEGETASEKTDACESDAGFEPHLPQNNPVLFQQQRLLPPNLELSCWSGLRKATCWGTRAGGRRETKGVSPPAPQAGPTAHRSHRLPRDPQSPCACDRLHRDEDPSWRTSSCIQGNGPSAPGPLGPSGTGSSHVTPWPSERQASAK